MEKILLWEKNPPLFDPAIGQEEPCLLPYPVEGAKSAVIVLPGGAYWGRAEDHEGVQIAKKLNENGITAFILRYRVAPYRDPVPKFDALRAIRVVRSLASKYGYGENHIAILGFSAGGHLTATTLTGYDRLTKYSGEDGQEDEIDKISCRPDLGVLCYPVIDLVSEYAHKGSAENLIGANPDRDARALAIARELSAQNNVSEDTPPCFLWHTAADSAVPVENSLLFAAELSKHKVPFEMHVYPYGDHGLGLGDCRGVPYVSSWMELCVKFIRLHFERS